MDHHRQVFAAVIVDEFHKLLKLLDGGGSIRWDIEEMVGESSSSYEGFVQGFIHGSDEDADALVEEELEVAASSW